MYFHKIVLIRELIISFNSTELQYILYNNVINSLTVLTLPIQRIFRTIPTRIFPTIISQFIYLFKYRDFLCATYLYFLYQLRLNDYFVPFLKKLDHLMKKKKM